MTVPEYHASLGARVREGIGVAPPTPPLCAFCRHPMSPVEPSGRISHFRHLVGGGACEERELAARPFEALRPTPGDAAAASRLRRRFGADWPYCYRVLDGYYGGLVEGFALKEFLALLDVLQGPGAWALRGLQFAELPYLMATLLDFPPASGRMRRGRPVRERWWRFWYADLGPSGHLWIEGHAVRSIVAACFRLRSDQALRPRSKDLDGMFAVSRVAGAFDDPRPVLPTFVVESVEGWLGRHPGFAPMP